MEKEWVVAFAIGTGLLSFLAGVEAMEIYGLKKRMHILEESMITNTKTAMKHAEAEETILSMFNDLLDEAQRINE